MSLSVGTNKSIRLVKVKMKIIDKKKINVNLSEILEKIVICIIEMSAKYVTKKSLLFTPYPTH